MDLKIKICPNCKHKDIVEDMTDNRYECESCGQSLLNVTHQAYFIEENLLAEYVIKNGHKC